MKEPELFQLYTFKIYLTVAGFSRIVYPTVSVNFPPSHHDSLEMSLALMWGGLPYRNGLFCAPPCFWWGPDWPIGPIRPRWLGYSKGASEWRGIWKKD